MKYDSRRHGGRVPPAQHRAEAKPHDLPSLRCTALRATTPRGTREPRPAPKWSYEAEAFALPQSQEQLLLEHVLGRVRTQDDLVEARVGVGQMLRVSA